MKRLYRVLVTRRELDHDVRVRISRGMAVLCGLVLLAGGCGPVDDTADRPSGQGAAAARDQLSNLDVGSWASMTGYLRDNFPHWSSQGQGCDTRDVVLKRDGKGVQATTDCKITQGTWYSVYDDKTSTDPQDFDIDHMIPLANAWRTGAQKWTKDQREEFANDLTRPQLIAVSASSNRSKGDQDPSQWKPPRRAYWCEYAQDWIAVKAYWRLIVTAAEKGALMDMLDTC